MSLFRTAVVLALIVCGCDEKPPSATDTAPPAATTGAAAGVTAGAATLELPQQREPYHGLVTAGQPTEDQLAKLKDAGYTAIVNLRTEGEPGYIDEKEKATRNMMLYAHIPIGGPDDLTPENVRKFADTMEQPMAKNGKVLLHCGSGNRSGALVALKAAWIDGRTVEDAIELGKKAGLTSMEDDVRAKLATPAAPK